MNNENFYESLSEEEKTRLVFFDMEEDLKEIALTLKELKKCCEDLKQSLRGI